MGLLESGVKICLLAAGLFASVRRHPRYVSFPNIHWTWRIAPESSLLNTGTAPSTGFSGVAEFVMYARLAAALLRSY